MATGDRSDLGIPLSVKHSNKSVVVGKEEVPVGGGAVMPAKVSSDVFFRLICFLKRQENHQFKSVSIGEGDRHTLSLVRLSLL